MPHYSTLDELRRASLVWVKCRVHDQAMNARRQVLIESMEYGTIVLDRNGRPFRVETSRMIGRSRRLECCGELGFADLGGLDVSFGRRLWVGGLPWRAAYGLELPILRGFREQLRARGAKTPDEAHGIFKRWGMPVRLAFPTPKMMGFFEYGFKTHNLISW